MKLVLIQINLVQIVQKLVFVCSVTYFFFVILVSFV